MRHHHRDDRDAAQPVQVEQTRRWTGGGDGQGATSYDVRKLDVRSQRVPDRAVFVARQVDRAIDRRCRHGAADEELESDAKEASRWSSRRARRRAWRRGREAVYRPFARMSTTSIAMQPARLAASASTGDGPARLSPSRVNAAALGRRREAEVAVPREGRGN